MYVIVSKNEKRKKRKKSLIRILVPYVNIGMNRWLACALLRHWNTSPSATSFIDDIIRCNVLVKYLLLWSDTIWIRRKLLP